MDYTDPKITVAELRIAAKERNIGTGIWRASVQKPALVAALVAGFVDVSTPAPAPSNGSDGLAQMIASIVAPLIPASCDEAKVQELIDAAMAQRPNNKLDITVNGAAKVTLDRQHKTFPDLLHECACRNSTWLVGPAGSGKTTAAANCAKALGLPFYFNGAIDSEYKLNGFIDANGVYRSRPFRQAYESGGVYLFDEVDSSLPGALLAFNAALANGHSDFPDGQIARHKDFICIAAGNTYNGASGEYCGRYKQDGAFLDRFGFIEWGYDEDLERSIVAQCYPGQEAWVLKVQKMRANCLQHGIRHIISPRASFNGAKSLMNGAKIENVLNVHVRKGLSNDLWAKVSA